jgi:hypothetical protein
LNPIVEKKINVATAVTISGTIIGSDIKANEANLPLNFPPRTIPIAAAVAITVETIAAIIAMLKEFQAAALNLALSSPVNISTYQRNDIPPQLVIDTLSLKL